MPLAICVYAIFCDVHVIIAYFLNNNFSFNFQNQSFAPLLERMIFIRVQKILQNILMLLLGAHSINTARS